MMEYRKVEVVLFMKIIKKGVRNVGIFFFIISEKIIIKMYGINIW